MKKALLFGVLGFTALGSSLALADGARALDRATLKCSGQVVEYSGVNGAVPKFIQLPAEAHQIQLYQETGNDRFPGFARYWELVGPADSPLKVEADLSEDPRDGSGVLAFLIESNSGVMTRIESVLSKVRGSSLPDLELSIPWNPNGGSGSGYLDVALSCHVE